MSDYITQKELDDIILKFYQKVVLNGEDVEDWNKMLSYIEEYHLTYEVFSGAGRRYREDMDKQEAIDCIAVSMMDWDL